MIPFVKNYSIKAKLMVIFITASGAALLLACIGFIAYDLFSLRRTLVKELEIAASLIGSACDAAITFNAREEAAETFKAFDVQPAIVAAGLYSTNGLFLYYPDNAATLQSLPGAPDPPGHRFENNQLHLTKDIISGGEKIGAIYVRSKLDYTSTLPFRYVGIASVVFALACFGGILVSSILQGQISHPLNELLTVADSVAKTQNYSLRAPKESEDEIGKLVDGFNNMLSQVQARDIALQRAQDELEKKVDERTKDLQLEIIQRQNTQQALERSKELAESASRAKSEFLAVMSHEIRTPMNGVIGMTSLLAESKLDKEQRDFVETIRLSGEALMVIINDILDFSKIEAGRMELEHQPYDLRSCVEECLDLFMPRASEKGLELAYTMDLEVPQRVVGDVTRTRQILANLIGNAIKFTERGEVEISVKLGDNTPDLSIPDGSCLLRFDIRDTGIGIPQDKLNRLFQAFSQVDSSTTRKYGGTGLGLAISRRLSELMGGRLSVRSVESIGSTFTFTIVAGKVATNSQSKDFVHVPTQVQNRCLLYVDDNETNLRILKNYSHIWGLRCLTANSTESAEQILKAESKVDALLLDTSLPGISGLEFAEKVRKNPKWRSVPIMLFSSGGSSDLRSKCDKLGISVILQKPIKPGPLLAGLQDALTIENVQATPDARPPALVQEDSKHGRPLSILLAEDNAINQLVARQLLQKLGYHADLVMNGHEAVQSLHRRHYDVVLMDVQMPELNGCDATKAIRSSSFHNEQPWIIAMTANALNEDREMCLSSGMDDYLSKPVRLTDLDAALRKAWAVKSSRLENRQKLTTLTSAR